MIFFIASYENTFIENIAFIQINNLFKILDNLSNYSD